MGVPLLVFLPGQGAAMDLGAGLLNGGEYLFGCSQIPTNFFPPEPMIEPLGLVLGQFIL